MQYWSMLPDRYIDRLTAGRFIRKQLNSNKTKVPTILPFSSVDTDVAAGRALIVPAKQKINTGAGKKA